MAPLVERSAESAILPWIVLAALVSLAVLVAPVTSAQQPRGAISVDSLQPSALSVDLGRVRPAQAEVASIVGIAADYGALSGTMRLRLEASYWQSRLTDAVMKTYTDLLTRVIFDPSHDDVVRPSRVSLYDVTIDAGVRWVPFQQTAVQPFAGGGVAVHVINAEGPLIDGTFVEKLFDSFSTGFFAEGGAVLKPAREFGIEARVRGDLVNGFRSVSARVGGVYYFGPLRRMNP